VPSWLLEEERAAVPQTPSPNLPNTRNQPYEGRSTYSGLSGSPDIRKNYYRSSRQQYRGQYSQDPQTTNPHEHRTRPQHQMLGSMHRMPPSEPIYLDIDPSIHQPMTVDSSGHRSPLPTSSEAMHSQNNATSTSYSKSPSRLRNLACTTSTPGRPVTPTSTERPPSRNSVDSASTTATPNRAGCVASSNRPPQSPSRNYQYKSSAYARPRSPGLSKYQSKSSPEQKDRSISPYNTAPIVSPNSKSGEANNSGLLMFGDDYDLGSINTGMSQQELLQKRRDVKKRRDGKYGKKKKNKERIINMPPRLLAMGSWDTTPITSKHKNQHPSHHKENKSQVRIAVA
jgi:hypothetical protein